MWTCSPSRRSWSEPRRRSIARRRVGRGEAELRVVLAGRHGGVRLGPHPGDDAHEHGLLAAHERARGGRRRRGCRSPRCRRRLRWRARGPRRSSRCRAGRCAAGRRPPRPHARARRPRRRRSPAPPRPPRAGRRYRGRPWRRRWPGSRPTARPARRGTRAPGRAAPPRRPRRPACRTRRRGRAGGSRRRRGRRRRPRGAGREEVDQVAHPRSSPCDHGRGASRRGPRHRPGQGDADRAGRRARARRERAGRRSRLPRPRGRRGDRADDAQPAPRAGRAHAGTPPRASWRWPSPTAGASRRRWCAAPRSRPRSTTGAPCRGTSSRDPSPPPCPTTSGATCSSSPTTRAWSAATTIR